MRLLQNLEGINSFKVIHSSGAKIFRILWQWLPLILGNYLTSKYTGMKLDTFDELRSIKNCFLKFGELLV